jgi:hypothetical protein
MKKRLFIPNGTSKSIKRRTDNTTTTEKEINNGAQNITQKIYKKNQRILLKIGSEPRWSGR